MAKLFDHVRPGDLIAANFMNQIIDEIQSLEDRVSQLGATGQSAVTVTGFNFTPPGPPRVGDRLEVDGTGFTIPSEANQVTIGGQTVPTQNFRSGGSDTKLFFDIPTVPVSLDPQGTLVTVVVRNANGAVGSNQLMLRPALVIPQGRLEAHYAAAPILPIGSPNISSPGTYVFTFSFTAFVNQQDTYQLTPSISPIDWKAQVFKDNADVPADSTQLTLPADTTGNGVNKMIRVGVTVPSSPSNNSAQLSFSVTEASPGGGVIPATPPPITIAINNPPPSPQIGVTASLKSPIGPFVGTRLQITRNIAATLNIHLVFQIAGNYSVTGSLANASGWSAPTIGPQNITVQAPVPANGAPVDVSVILIPGQSATDTDFQLTIAATDPGSTLVVPFAQSLTIA